MGTYDKDIQQAYVAFFNRPADVGGLAYWNEQATKAGGIAPVLAAFGASAEYKALYNGKTNYAIVETIYQNLFNRGAEPAALSYWGDRLANGTFNIGNVAYSIVVGAQNADKTAIANKVAAATSFTSDLNTSAKILAYETMTSAGSDAVKAWLKAVTSDAATIPSATSLSAIQTTVASNSTGSATAGQTFTLTTATDAITGTAGNDTVLGNSDSYTTGDSVNGGAGTDTLEVLLTGTGFNKVATVSAVEVVKVQDLNTSTNTTDANTINMANFTGVNEIVVAGSTATAGTKFTSVNDTATTVSLKSLSTANATNGITVTHVGTGLTGTADALTVKLDSVTAAQKLTVTPANTTTGGFETINVVSSGSNNTGAVTLVSAMQAGVTKQVVNVSGDKNLSLVVSTDMKEVNAGSLTGALKLDVTGAADYTITGGSGADRFDFGNAFTSADKVAGGDGVDRIAVGNSTTAITFSTVATNLNTKVNGVNNVSGIEVFEYTGSAAFAADASLITVSGLTGYATSGTIAAAAQTTGTAAGTVGVAITNQSNAQTFSFEGNVTGGNGGFTTSTTDAAGVGGHGVTFAPAVNNASNSLDITLKGVTVTGGAGGGAGATANNAAGGSAADFTGFETINITSSKAATGTATNAFVGGAAGTGTAGTAAGGGATQANTILASANATFNISGDNEINLGLIANSNQSVTVNASNLTGKLTVSTGTAADVITGGSGVNLITLTGGVDELNLAKSTAKADVITITAATNTTSTGFVKIASFTNSATTTIGDKLDLKDTNAVLAGSGSSVDMGAVVAGLTASLSSTGILTFAGTGAATATLANKITAAFSTSFINNADDKVLAFEHGGNTYVVKSDDSTQGFNAGTDSVIELTGLVGLTGLSDSASNANVVWVCLICLKKGEV